MHKLYFFAYHEWNDARENSLERAKVPMPANQVLLLTGCIFEASYGWLARVNKIKSMDQSEL